MRRVVKALAIVAVVGLISAPTAARAEGFVNPWAGVVFDNSQGDEGNWGFGVNAGAMGAGIIGGEIDFGYLPNFYGDVVDNHVLNLMGNLIVGIPVGGTRGAGFRPYVTGGLGLIRSSIDTAVVTDTAAVTNDFGYNLGFGAMGYFSDHFGVRADVKYFRELNDDTDDDDLLDLDLGSLKFWRAAFGIVIR
ncbi:MAG: outer membrane beta-barrel protein [Vicinamibacterales bacterium]